MLNAIRIPRRKNGLVNLHKITTENIALQAHDYTRASIMMRRCHWLAPYRSVHKFSIRYVHSSKLLLHRNAPKFDESELLSSQITSQPYKAKRPANEFEWPEKSDEQAKKDHEARVERMMRLSAVFQGFLFLAAVGIAGTAYLKWPQVKSWWITTDIAVDDDTIEKLIHIKKKNNMAEIPVIDASELGPEVPGLYQCGGLQSSSRKGKSGVIFPRRNPHFDNKYLRDVCLVVIDGIERNLAIDEKGNLLEWNCDSCKLLLPNQDLISVKESNGCAYALNKNGKILIIPLDADDEFMSKNISFERSWIFPWKKYIRYGLTLDVKQSFNCKGEKRVTQFDTGKDHLVLVSNIGKAYSCSTGLLQRAGSKSFGQFGIPGMSQFDKFPACNELHEIELLNNSLGDLNRVQRRQIVQVSCGDYHTVARDSNGNILVFGSNKFGQLGYPISYDTEQIAFPKPLTRFHSYFVRDCIVRCVDVRCSGQATYVTMKSLSPGRTASSSDLSCFSFGNGQFGELGNGRFMNSQSEPAPIKVLSEPKLSEEVEQWSCGQNHVMCKMKSGKVLAWGRNDNGQLGNGKRIKQCKPQNIPQLLSPGSGKTPDDIYNSELHLLAQQAIATGDNSSCFYWKK